MLFPLSHASCHRRTNVHDYSLSLDHAVSTPVKLAEIVTSAHSPLSLDAIINGCVERKHYCPPGKFYGKEAALSLVDTLRAGSTSAKVVSSVEADAKQIALFDRFSSLLSDERLVSNLTRSATAQNADMALRSSRR
jgi:hypothetical protein